MTSWQKTLFYIGLTLIPIGIIFWLLMYDLNPSGTFSVSAPVWKSSPYIERFLPDTRALAITRDGQKGFQRVIDEPIYASIHTPGEYDEITVAIEFENASHPITEIGFLVSENPIQYTFAPLQNKIIDELEWNSILEDNVSLYQREDLYDSISSFYENPPERSSIAVYNTDLDLPFRLSGYVPSTAFQTINTSLRGYHEYYTYIKNEPLMLTAKFMDMNREYGEDEVRILIFNEDGEPIAEEILEDDGEIEGNQNASGMRSISIVTNGLEEGVYKVILKANRDIFFRELLTRQRYLAFSGPVYVGDEVGYRENPSSVSFWSDATQMQFYTYHADAAQKILVGSNEMAIPDAYKTYSHQNEEGFVRTELTQGDILITTDGLISFTTSQFFSPLDEKLTVNSDVDRDGIDYILASYTPPIEQNGHLYNESTFKIRELWQSNGDLKLVLSAPGLASVQNELILHRVFLEFIRDPIAADQVISEIVRQVF